MKLLVVILNKVDLLEDLLSAFLEVGISGATVIDGIGMGRILTIQVPIFSGLRDAFPGTCPSNRIILSVIKEDQIPDVEIVLEEVCGSFEEQGTGVYFFLPVDHAKGYRPGY